MQCSEKFAEIAGKRVNRIAFGTARYAAVKMPTGEIVPNHDHDREEMGLLHHAFGLGYNFIDTARAYGDSELLIGWATKAWPRDKWLLVSKIGQKPMEPYTVEAAIRETSERLKARPDILMIHDSWKGEMDRGGKMDDCLDVMNWALDEGGVTSVGISNFKPAELSRAIDRLRYPISAYQAKINLMNARPDAAQLLDICRKNSIPFMASSALDRGSLIKDPKNMVFTEIAAGYGMTVAQLGILFLLNEGIFPVVQSHNPAHMAENQDAFKYDIIPEDQERLREVVFAQKGSK